MPWKVAFWSAFAEEFDQLDDAVRIEALALIELLAAYGPELARPHCDTLKGSRHANMKELRFRCPDGLWRIAFAFDPERTAILLVGGNKVGVSQDRFYRRLLRLADARFDAHLDELNQAKGQP